jgi:hypothetical protein
VKKLNQSQKPEAAQTKESLISSSTLPEFADIDKEYASLMAEVAAEMQADADKAAVNTAPPEKAKRGRKKTTLAAVTESPIETAQNSIQVEAEVIEDAVCLPLDMIFERSKKEPLKKIERKAFSQALAKVINKYAPLFGNKYAEEIGLAFCAATIFIPRFLVPKEKEKEIATEPKPEMTFRNKATEAEAAHV